MYYVGTDIYTHTLAVYLIYLKKVNSLDPKIFTNTHIHTNIYESSVLGQLLIFI